MMAAPSFSLVDQLNLAEMAALLALAPVLISNNTGPVHMAAALGTPTIDIYALTNPQHTPWAVPHRVLSHDVPCKYCYKSICPEGHHNCLRLITPAEVVSATLELFNETAQLRHRQEEILL
jgi:ADP-heptose:LPS heptosyltransferase